MNLTIPIGQSKTATLKALDASNTDVTATGTFTAASSDNTVVTATALSFSTNAFAIKVIAAGSAQITYTFSNPSGQLTSSPDTINPPDPATSITVTYA